MNRVGQLCFSRWIERLRALLTRALDAATAVELYAPAPCMQALASPFRFGSARWASLRRSCSARQKDFMLEMARQEGQNEYYTVISYTVMVFQGRLFAVLLALAATGAQAQGFRFSDDERATRAREAEREAARQERVD